MRQFKSLLPFFLAVLLLSMSISIPVFLFTIQDKNLLHRVKTETLAEESQAESQNASISILDRLELMRDHRNVASMSGDYALVGPDGKTAMENDHTNQVLNELEKLQARGGFPAFDLRKDLKFSSEALEKLTYYSDQGWELSIFIMSFLASGIEYHVWADADTYTIYQYEAIPTGDKSVSVDEQTVKEVFTDYLSLSTKQFDTLYSIVNDEQIQLILKYYSIEYK